MISREALRAAGRLAVLAAVGLSLAATSVYPDCDPPLATERLDFDVTSDCGPTGRVQLFHQGSDDYVCRKDMSVEVTGSAAVGLPDQGHLIDAPPDASPRHSRDSRGIAAGDLVLAGDVAVPGAVPPVTVIRVCRFTPGATAGALALVCIGPAPESACTGTLTPAVEAP